MKTTLNQIKQLAPCESGWKKLMTYLGPDFPEDREFPVAKVVKSNGISDTFWLLIKIMESDALKKLAVKFASDCAERVLPADARAAYAAYAASARAAAADAVAVAAYIAPGADARAVEREWQESRLIELLR